MTPSALRNVLARPSAADPGPERLAAWDDYPVHQSAALLSSVTPASPKWSERFYFNAIAPTGEIVMIVGGGVYPSRGISECYFCRLDGDRQINVRTSQALPPEGEEPSGPFAIHCESPMTEWSVAVDLPDDAFAGRFRATIPPFLYRTIDIAPSEPGGEFDLFRHFIGVGRWDLVTSMAGQTDLLGVRDRTWGVRTRRPRLHLWSVVTIDDRCVALKHQELADGSIHFTEAGVTHADGRLDPMRIVEHDLVFDPAERQVTRGRVELDGDAGALAVEFERVGTGIRLAGAGYDDGQGDRDTSAGVQRDVYELGDRTVAARTGRGTIDVGVRAQISGTWTGSGIGVVETAVARDHARYGTQITGR